ncbi:MAG: hypothetical protein ABMA02_12040 [Saprospiraceae bacterium]
MKIKIRNFCVGNPAQTGISGLVGLAAGIAGKRKIKRKCREQNVPAYSTKAKTPTRRTRSADDAQQGNMNVHGRPIIICWQWSDIASLGYENRIKSKTFFAKGRLRRKTVRRYQESGQ